MSKSTMNKIYRSFFSLIFFLLMFTAIYGCGNGPDTGTTNVSYNVALTADITSLAAGHSTVVTATVTDNSGNPASGQTVTFSLLINNSGAADLTPVGTVTTDASGKAVKVYTAGSTGTASVQDVLQAIVTGSMGFVIITRTGSDTPEGYRLTLTATPVSLAANAMSALVAKVINNADGSDAVGVTVTFAIPINNTDATLADISGSTTAPITGITDAQGYAIAIYTAGTGTPSLSIQDAVTASVTGSAGAAIITRLPSVGTGNRIISFTEDPETSLAEPIGPLQLSSEVIMKVKVTTDNLTSPVQGVTVTFSIILGDGTITNSDGDEDNPLDVLTDTNGEAYVIFTRPISGLGETIIRAQIPGTINGGDAARIVYWTAVTPE